MTSSPGIGLQHFAISYDCSALSTFSLRRKGIFLSILFCCSSESFFSFLDPISFNSQYLITLFAGLFLIVFLRLLRFILPRPMPEYSSSLFSTSSVSYTHLRAHETVLDIVCRLLL